MTSIIDDSLDDDLSDLLGGAARQNVRQPANFVPVTERIFTERCPRCGGTGSWGNRGRCFKCNGSGRQTFKTAPDVRAKARTSENACKARKFAEQRKDLDAAIETFKVVHPELYAWMTEQAERFPFANAMLAALRQYGSLTDGQLAASQRCLDGLKRAQAERAARETTAPEIAVLKIEEAFAKATKALKKPRLHLDAFTIKHAGANSKNAGALYVTEGEEYLGKIVGGKFLAVRSCGDERQAKVIAAAADPQAATIRYGRLTGCSGCCGRQLVDPESVARGIGPICAARYGW